MNILDLFNQNKMNEHEDFNKKSGGNDFLKVAMIAIPTLLMALKTRNMDDKKAGEFKDTLSRHENSSGGSIFDRIINADKEDGSKIVDHILGDEKESVFEKIAGESGVGVDEVKKVLSQISPSLLEQLASDTKGDRTVESVRQSTEEQLKKYNENENTLDLGDIVNKIGGSLGKNFGDILGGIFK